MNHYLVVFERTQGRVLRLEHFDEAASAMRARFDAERLHRGKGDIEIVVLGARSETALRDTHARYFEGAKELAIGGARRVKVSTEHASAP